MLNGLQKSTLARREPPCLVSAARSLEEDDGTCWGLLVDRVPVRATRSLDEDDCTCWGLLVDHVPVRATRSLNRDNGMYWGLLVHYVPARKTRSHGTGTIVRVDVYQLTMSQLEQLDHWKEDDSTCWGLLVDYFSVPLVVVALRDNVPQMYVDLIHNGLLCCRVQNNLIVLLGKFLSAAIWTRRNFERHINMVYLKLYIKKKDNARSERARQDRNMLNSLSNSMHTYTRVYNAHTHPYTRVYNCVIPTPTHTPTPTLMSIMLTPTHTHTCL